MKGITHFIDLQMGSIIMQYVSIMERVVFPNSGASVIPHPKWELFNLRVKHIPIYAQRFYSDIRVAIVQPFGKLIV